MSNFTLKKWDSRSELLSYLESLQSLVLGSSSEGLREFYSTELEKCTIGICSQGLGLSPSLLRSANSNLTCVGYNQAVAGIDGISGSKVFDIDLPSPFYEFHKLKNSESFLVIHELGVLRVHSSGDLIWQVDTSDVVVDVKTERDDYLYLKLMEGDCCVVDVQSGSMKKGTYRA